MFLLDTTNAGDVSQDAGPATDQPPNPGQRDLVRSHRPTTKEWGPTKEGGSDHQGKKKKLSELN